MEDAILNALKYPIIAYLNLHSLRNKNNELILIQDSYEKCFFGLLQFNPETKLDNSFPTA